MKIIVQLKIPATSINLEGENVTMLICKMIVESYDQIDLINSKPYDDEIDNQMDGSEGSNAISDTFIELILDVNSDVYKNTKGDKKGIIFKEFCNNIDRTPPKIVDSYLKGEDQYILMEMNEENPKINVDFIGKHS